MRNYIEVATQYAQDVIGERIPAGKLLRLAVERQAQDLRESAKDGNPYRFDVDKASRVCAFVEALKHHKGKLAGQAIHLEPWQVWILTTVFGWVRREDGGRRFRKVYIEVSRKQGKTTLGAAVALYAMLFDGEAGAEVYTVATKRDQAKISFDDAKSFCQTNAAAKARLDIRQAVILDPATGSKIQPLTADYNTLDGLNPHFALIDEYHAHATDELLNVIESGMGARLQPLTWIITTAGSNLQGPCYKERDYVARILEGMAKDPTVFGVVYSMDEGDRFEVDAEFFGTEKDRRMDNWKKANPNLGVSIEPAFLENRIREALESPQKMNDVLTKNFNQWVQADTRWILPEKWTACAAPVDAEALRGRRCFGGLDLSTTTDVSAFVLAFPPELPGEPFRLLPRFWLPGDKIIERERRDKVPYRLWAETGLLQLTDGDVIDYDFIEAQILRDAQAYQLQEIAFDPYNSTSLVSHLQDEGVPMYEFRQGFLSMSPAAKDFEKKILRGEIAHGGDPVLAWMAANVEIVSDPAGNIKPMKPKRESWGKRIDGIIAAIMATWRATVSGEGPVELTGEEITWL